jgi:hypothetical protein
VQVLMRARLLRDGSCRQSLGGGRAWLLQIGQVDEVDDRTTQ